MDPDKLDRLLQDLNNKLFEETENLKKPKKSTSYKLCDDDMILSVESEPCFKILIYKNGQVYQNIVKCNSHVRVKFITFDEIKKPRLNIVDGRVADIKWLPDFDNNKPKPYSIKVDCSIENVSNVVEIPLKSIRDIKIFNDIMPLDK